jgi:hypothetical protein
LRTLPLARYILQFHTYYLFKKIQQKFKNRNGAANLAVNFLQELSAQ